MQLHENQYEVQDACMMLQLYCSMLGLYAYMLVSMHLQHYAVEFFNIDCAKTYALLELFYSKAAESVCALFNAYLFRTLSMFVTRSTTQCVNAMCNTRV